MAWDWKAKKRTTSTPAAFRWEKVESSVCWWSVELPPQSYTSSAAARPQMFTPTQGMGRGVVPDGTVGVGVGVTAGVEVRVGVGVGVVVAAGGTMLVGVGVKGPGVRVAVGVGVGVADAVAGVLVGVAEGVGCPGAVLTETAEATVAPAPG